jgi:hypothetical protein
MTLHFHFYFGCAEAAARIIPLAFFGSRLGYHFFCSFFICNEHFGHSTYDANGGHVLKEMLAFLREPHADCVVHGGDPQNNGSRRDTGDARPQLTQGTPRG